MTVPKTNTAMQTADTVRNNKKKITEKFTLLLLFSIEFSRKKLMHLFRLLFRIRFGMHYVIFFLLAYILNTNWIRVKSIRFITVRCTYRHTYTHIYKVLSNFPFISLNMQTYWWACIQTKWEIFKREIIINEP